MAKINDEQLKNIPISFSKIKEYESTQTDSRFTEVLIKILHLGRNYNGSVFKREIVENAIPTLANTPILGFIELNKEGEDDFSDHRIELVNKAGTLKMQYMGHAYGVIPESFVKEAYFSEELCTDGIMREFLFIKGLLFNKFDYVVDMFKSHDGSYNQSMELSDNYSGTFDTNEGGFVFDSFQFNGACIIACNPAMIDSEITTNFSQDQTKNIADEIENKLNEFAKYFSKKEEKNNMAKKKIEEVEEQFEEKDIENLEKKEPTKLEEKVDETKDFEKGKEVCPECGQKPCICKNAKIDDGVCPKCGNDPCTCEDEDFAKEEKTEEVKEEMACGDKDKENMSKEDVNKEYTLKFSLSHEDIRSQLYDKLYDMEHIENTCYAIIATNDNYFKYLDYCSGQFYKQSYIKSEDSIAFMGEREEIFNVFVDKETKDAIANVTYSNLKQNLDEANAKIQEYSKANVELLKFQMDIKENERKAEIDEVISRFSTLDALDLENCRQKAYNKELNLEQVEEKLYAIVGKMNFSKKSETKDINEEEEIKASVPTSYSVSLANATDSKCPYEGCEGLFS